MGGAAPPRQTEVFLRLPGSDVQTQIDMALDAFESFDIPSLPDNAQKILREQSKSGICLSVITSADGFVRLGVLVPKPTKETVTELCGIVGASVDDIHSLES